jgi:BirA family biotin operon repressor/biotin-[acetyl-CoA-carboxylase] ligase
MDTIPLQAYTRDGVADRVETRVIGRCIHWHETLPSTNDRAIDLAESRAPEGTVVVAEEQTAGRGRLGRPWVSPRGGVWLSVILRPDLPLPRVPLIGLAASVAAARSILTTTGLAARVKWPNDVLVGGRKVVGVLLEAGAEGEWVVVGIGVNANVSHAALPKGAGYPATSLQELLGRPMDRVALLQALLGELERGYDGLRLGDTPSVLRRWREMSDTLGRNVRVETAAGAIEGVAADIDGEGALLIERRGGAIQRVVAGEVTLREVE